MFKKKCSRCKNKIKKDYEFCPYCGNNVISVSDEQDYGILGKNDLMASSMPSMPSHSFIDKIFSQTMKLLEKEMRTMAEEMNPPQKNHLNEINSNMNIQFFVNGKRIFPQQPARKNTDSEKVKVIKMSEEKLEKFSKLPRKEPKSNMKRIGEKIIYELEVPGVTDIEDILINRLESSIEVKALAKDKSYSKVLNVNLPILRYGLNNGNLILELQGN